MGQGQGPPGATRATHSPQGEHGEDCEDEAAPPLTLTQPDPASGWGMTTGAGEASTGRGHPCPPAGGGRAGKPLALTSNFGPSGRPIPQRQAFLDTKKHSATRLKRPSDSTPRKVSFGVI